MITIHDLLENEGYKKFFCTVPHLEQQHGSTPWRLAIQKDPHGTWMSKDYATYQEAFLKLKKHLTRINDAAIICKAIPFEPPSKTVRIKGKYIERRGKKIPVTKRVPWSMPLPAGEDSPHHWCTYCRRPTVFKTFEVHPILTRKRLNGIPIDPYVERCTICGASARLVNIKKH